VPSRPGPVRQVLALAPHVSALPAAPTAAGKMLDDWLDELATVCAPYGWRALCLGGTSRPRRPTRARRREQQCNSLRDVEPAFRRCTATPFQRLLARWPRCTRRARSLSASRQERKLVLHLDSRADVRARSWRLRKLRSGSEFAPATAPSSLRRYPRAPRSPCLIQLASSHVQHSARDAGMSSTRTTLARYANRVADPPARWAIQGRRLGEDHARIVG